MSATNTTSTPAVYKQTLPSGLILRFEAPSGLAGTNKIDAPLSIDTPPGTPIHMSINGGGKDNSSSIKSNTSNFKNLSNDSNNNKDSRSSPQLAPLGLPPMRVDTDEDLMQKQVCI